ncbi:MAG: hypothetical protein A2284_18445 [Deltaproteobacteria bacterium RIFOXYA12_FULL_61_11]|nr:MAG: hypothetical protein A2284_18445 [Deltaproteobacteria bacterium RIFOXYA12_FULL_61_11]
MYATVTDLREEGVNEAMASDARLCSLLHEAGAIIDRTTGWFFEPRSLTLTLDGRGHPTLETPVPLIRLDRLMVGGQSLSTTLDELLILGAPVGPGFSGPFLVRLDGTPFPRGRGNVVAEGLWGFTEPNTLPEGGTPLEIRRACLLLVLRLLHPMAGDEAAEAKNRWRVLEERTRDQSYKLAPLQLPGPFTGDWEIDGILLRYRRPLGMGGV